MVASVETSANCAARWPIGDRDGLAIGSLLGAIVLAVATFAPGRAGAQQGDDCGDWSARLLEAEGAVEFKRALQENWAPARAEDQLCIGDSLRVGLFGRAAVVLPNDTVVRLDHDTAVTFPQPRDEKRTWLEQIIGLTHIISRNPRALRVTTPFANAGIEGTEFSVEVTDALTNVEVFEGTVVLEGPLGAVDITADHAASAARGSIEEPRSLTEPYGNLAWTRYFPPIIAGELPAPDSAETADASSLVARAQSRLAVGRVDAAEADVSQALAIMPDYSDALASRAMMLLADSQFTAAQEAVDRALAGSGPKAAARLAQSHVLQRRGELDAAAAILREAADAYPDNDLVWARLAEINVSIGEIDSGLAAAAKAADLNPNRAQSHVVRGFSALSSGNTTAAVIAFREAIRVEPSSPMAHLGLGLALIRDGSPAEGRAELENAVSLDAGNGLVRSYVAKAYYDERRDELAEAQLAIAKGLDSTDATAYLYDAYRKQNANEPVAAFQDLEVASGLNRNRAVYRSGLWMDDDLGARSAGRGRIYRTLGFGQLALLQGWTSVNEYPFDFAGHRLLADMYSTLPRHQIARVNELYQAQLLQPGTVTLTDPQLGEANLFLLNSVGPTDLAHSEFAPLISRNGVRFQGSGIAGGNETRGDSIVVGGTNDRVDYNFGQFHFETMGFRENNDIEQDLLSATVQYRPTEKSGLLLELRSNSVEKGDLLLKFDPGNYNPMLRQLEDATSLRLGASYAFSSDSKLVGSLAFEDAELDISLAPGLGSRYDLGNATAQVLHLFDPESSWSLASGVSVRVQDLDQQLDYFVPLPDPPFLAGQTESIAENLRFVTLYSYANVDLTSELQVTVGASVDLLDGQDLERDRFNPKLGFTWAASSSTVVRGAAFRTLNGPVISKQIIQPSLEPSQVAGFNQFFFGPEGDEATRIGLAMDHAFSATIYGGAEISSRDVVSPIFLAADPTLPPMTVDQEIDESLLRAYLYWTPHSRIAVGATLESERVDNHGEGLAEEFTELETRRLPISINYFSPSGFSAGLTATPVRQKGMFWNRTLPPDAPPIPGEDAFWVFDLSMGYRLPNRRGLIELTARNLFDAEFRFQDTDPETPRIFPERFVGLRFTLAY